MAADPAFATTPKIGIAVVSAANTARDGSGTIATVFTAGSSGSVIHRIVIRATVTTTGGMVRLFIHDGSNARLWRESVVSAVTVGAATEGFSEEMNLSGAASDGDPPLVLPTGYSLRASTHNAESFNVIAEGGDL